MRLTLLRVALTAALAAAAGSGAQQPQLPPSARPAQSAQSVQSAQPGPSGQAAPREQPLSIVPRAEAEALRRQLATPAPAAATPDELRRHYTLAIEAAQRLADRVARRRVLLEAVERLPDDARWHNDLAVLLRDDGEWDASRREQERAIALAREPVQRLFYETNLVVWLVYRGAPEASERLAATRTRLRDALAAPEPGPRQRVLGLRALARLAAMESVLFARQGRLVERLEATVLSERHAREALQTAEQGRADRAIDLRNAATDLATAQKRHAQALRALERDAEAEAVLVAHGADIARLPVAADFAAGAHAAMAALRLDQREFAAAERQQRLALQVRWAFPRRRLCAPSSSPTWR